MRKNRPRGGRKTTCSKCDNSLEESRAGKYRYCKGCHAEHMRLNRPKHSELKPEARQKANCRAHTKVYVERGNLVKESCCNCGHDHTEAHHSDYSNPKLVRWVCRPCHLELHGNAEMELRINSMPPSAYRSANDRAFEKVVKIEKQKVA